MKEAWDFINELRTILSAISQFKEIQIVPNATLDQFPGCYIEFLGVRFLVATTKRYWEEFDVNIHVVYVEAGTDILKNALDLADIVTNTIETNTFTSVDSVVITSAATHYLEDRIQIIINLKGRKLVEE